MPTCLRHAGRVAAAIFPAGKGSWRRGPVDLGGPLFCGSCCSNGVLKFIDTVGKMNLFFPFSLFLGVLPRLYQACYGILKVPEGSWLCRTCALGVQPKCLLCPKRGGALKPTRSGTKWVHVSCALWIPEVGRHEGGQPWGIAMGSSPGEVGLRGTQNSSSTR